MKNFLIALVCSILLHLVVVILVAQNEAVVGMNVKQEFPDSRSDTKKIYLSLVPSKMQGDPLLPQGGAHDERSEQGESPIPSSTSSESTSEKQDLPESVDQGAVKIGEYFPVDQLTIKPLALNDVALGSNEVLYLFLNGTAVLSLWISERGEVAEVSVEADGVPDEISAGMVLAFKQLRFSPGILDGNAVKSVMRIEVGVE